MNSRWRGENIREIASASLLEEMQIAGHSLRTDYSRTVNLWQKYFPGNFKIFLFDDLLDNSANFLTTIQDYIGIKRFVNQKILDKKSNADRKKVEIPSEVQKFVVAEYAETINKFRICSTWYKRALAELTDVAAPLINVGDRGRKQYCSPKREDWLAERVETAAAHSR